MDSTLKYTVCVSGISRHAATGVDGLDGGLQDGFRTHCTGAMTSVTPRIHDVTTTCGSKSNIDSVYTVHTYLPTYQLNMSLFKIMMCVCGFARC